MGWTKRGVLRLKRLSAKQEDQLQVFAAKWDKIARSTEPWDEEAVEDGIRQFYKANGCRQPKRGFWYSTKLAGAYNHTTYRWEDVEKRNPRFGTLDRSEWSIRCYLQRSIEPSVIKIVEEFMHRNVARSLSARRIAELDDARRSMRHKDGAWLRHLIYGQQDAPWLAIADYFATVHGNEHCAKLAGLMQAVASCGFIFLSPTNVTYVNRPETAKFDDQGRLHCEDAPAVKYREDWGFFYLHGVATPMNYIQKPIDELKLEEIINERNSAVRMVVMEKFGFARLLASTKNRVISEAAGNELIEIKLRVQEHNERFRVLRLRWQDKIGQKETLLPVPRLRAQFGKDVPDDVDDCEQVRRWTLGWSKEALAIAET